MRILAIDPGNEQSAYVVFDTTYQTLGSFGKTINETLIGSLNSFTVDVCVCEMIACYGMPVGAEVFETCVWIGRYMQMWGSFHTGSQIIRLKRAECKMHLCHSMKAKDGNIRQALIDRFGPPGKKSSQGKLYGVSGDVWAALAVAVTYADKYIPKKEKVS